jgi:hypothetical protein
MILNEAELVAALRSAGETLEVVELTRMFVGTPSCEADHSVTPEVPCSVVVTHLYRVECLGRRKLVCGAAAGYVLSVLTDERGCVVCHRLAGECWSVTPV